jgi:glycerol-3-phosphate dehydrogenase
MIGTTDTDYEGDLDDIEITEDDIQYLLESAKTHVPGLSLEKKDIISTFAGLRPLIKQTGGTASQVSREHKVVQTGKILSLFGGKYTTFRKMSEDVTKEIHKQLRNGAFRPLTESLSHWGGKIKDIESFIEKNADLDTKSYGISKETYAHLVSLYGSKYADVLNYASGFKDGLEPIENTPHILGEVYYARDVEKAKRAEDFLRRRTRLQLSQRLDLRSKIEPLFNSD